MGLIFTFKSSRKPIKKAGSVSGQDYGNFSVTLRKIDDTDNKVNIANSVLKAKAEPKGRHGIKYFEM